MGALCNLASNNDSIIKIAAVGTISPLVALLGPQSSSGVQQKMAIRALWSLAYNDDNRVKIRSEGGAVAALTRLLESISDEEVKILARGALDKLK